MRIFEDKSRSWWEVWEAIKLRVELWLRAKGVAKKWGWMSLQSSWHSVLRPGKIPRELGTLSKVVTLTFFNNNLTGGIPPSLGNLFTLEKMNVAFNNLEGNILIALGDVPQLGRFTKGEMLENWLRVGTLDQLRERELMSWAFGPTRHSGDRRTWGAVKRVGWRWGAVGEVKK
ncbi:hypothetical protein Scep_015003 [Stephania cephalantha]|uniref:Uncharacterized protein n=1 Tax=Stephania cephalantha TaxID=152367 RepID=A0AAP0NZY8_9MAGN